MKIQPITAHRQIPQLSLTQRWNQNRDEILLDCAAAASVLLFGLTFFAGKIFVSVCILAIGSICHYVASNLEKFQKFQNIVSSLRVEAKAYEEQNAAHKQQIKKLEQQNDAYRLQNELFSKQISTFNSENTKLKTQVQRLGSTTQQLSTVTTKAKNHADTLATQNTRLEQSLGTLQNAHHEVSNQLSTLSMTHEQAINELNTIKKAHSDLSLALTTLQRTNQELNITHTNLDRDYQRFKVVHTQIEEQNRGLRKSNAALSLQIATLQKSTSSMQDLLTLCKANVEQLKGQLGSLDTTSNALSTTKQGLEVLQSKLLDAVAQATIQISASQGLCQEVAKQFEQGLAAVQQEIRDLKTDNSTLEKLQYLKELREQVTQEHGKLEAMKAEEQDLIARLEELRKQYEETLGKFKEERSKFAAENESLRSTNASLKVQVDKFAQKLQNKG